MASKTYTAQEMREMADAIINECEDEEAGLVYESPAKAGHIFYPDEASAMLRQAAKMRERCEEVIADVNGPNSRFDHGIATPDFDANEIVDYILHGDAVKKEVK